MTSSFPNFASNIFGIYCPPCMMHDAAQTSFTVTICYILSYSLVFSKLRLYLSFFFIRGVYSSSFLSFFLRLFFLSSFLPSSLHCFLQSGLLASAHSFTNGVVEG